jgi:hypothetical protein
MCSNLANGKLRSSKQQEMQDGFLLLASRSNNIITGTILDFPQYILFSSQFPNANFGQLGLFGDPWQWFGHLDMAMLRAVRLVVDTGLHAKKWTKEQAVDYMLEATGDTRQQLSRLKSLGLTLAMDDFGTGYSSLSYLKKFPIDVIKIDRSFIKDIPQNQDDMEITSAVIAMAHNLKLKVVAEGVESRQQADLLLQLGCELAQGFLYAPALPAAELDGLELSDDGPDELDDDGLELF